MFPDLTLGSLHVSTYYILTSLGGLIASLWFIRRAEARDLARVTAIDLTLVLLFGGFVGARLLHVVFEEPDHYAAHPLAIFAVWNGGFVYLGGLLTAAIAGSFFCQSRREPFWTWADAAALPAGLGYGIGRIGCLLNGCCFGSECHLPWAIHLHGADRHPTQIYAALWAVGSVAVLARLEPRLKRTGALFHAWLITFCLGRIVMELFRDDPRGPSILGLSLGIWMSVAIVSATMTHWLRQT